MFGIVEQCRKYKLTNNLVSIIILGIEVGHKKTPGAYHKEQKESPGMALEERMEGTIWK